ncbi:MAG: peptidoglycan DD-metalloendopeptidase family protein [Erysipelotrichaceae bacterium]|nr:peptidoglycan DD-metalloendopeptidase family protein [Erysipelotrichaceae bacterium]
MKKFLPIFFMAILAIAITVATNSAKIFSEAESGAPIVSKVNEAIIEQDIIAVSSQEHMVYKLYDAGRLVGILSDLDPISDVLKSVYDVEFAEIFPDKDIYLGEDLYIAQELSYYEFEDVSAQIKEYIQTRDVYTVQAYSVEFADSNGVYANIFVNDLDIYEEALVKYLGYFIDPEALTLLRNNQKTQALNTYGTRDVSFEIEQTITTSETYAPSNQVFTTSDQVLEFLKYGDNTEREYYTVQEFDSVAGVGAKNHGLSATQIMNINSDIIKSVDQVLEVGTQLCVSYFTPVIDVVVYRENMKKEPVYASETLYIEDPTIREGKEEVRQASQAGSQNALYLERWENGVLVSGELKNSVVTLQPVQEIVARGTMVIPGVGTGTFRWPVDNPFISCGWGCYSSHRAIDIQNMYDRYGNLYAADRGTVVTNSYHYINGNYMIIDHGNGFQTYYGHMNTPGFIPEGETVDKGDVIGQIGMTGKASGPHVHFFIMENGERRNPCEGFLPCYE